MENLFSILIWGIFLVIFLVAVKKKGKTQTKKSLQPAVKEARQERRTISSFDPSMQDNQHDWLAKQLADERKSYREVSEMFEAKLSHLSSCDAENNRLDHTLHCDARRLAEDSRLQ